MKLSANKWKRFAIALLTVACCVLSLFGVACGGEKKPTATTVVNFENQEVNVAYNSDVSLNAYVTAEDDIGEVHKGVAVLKDSKGENVELFENRFIATDKEGYIATITAQVAQKTFTKTVKLNVIDASIPTITMDYLLQGLVGSRYELPMITVSKAYDMEPIVPEVKIYFSNNGTKEEMTVQDGGFMPTKEGYYTIEVVATDRFGYSKEYEQEFFIQHPASVVPMPVGVLENYDESISANRVTLGTDTQRIPANDKVTWLESYTTNEETRYGVLKVSLKKGDYFWLNFTALPEDLEELGITEITVKAAIANSTGTVDNMLRWNVNGTERNNPFGVGTVAGNPIPWQEVTVSVETLKSYARFATDGVWETLGNGGAGNWLIRCASDAIVYIDEITYTAPPKEEPMPDGVLENFSNEYYSLQRNCVGTGEYLVAPSLAGKTEWLETYTIGEDTRNGVLHVTLGYGQYWTAQFTRTAEELAALGVQSISFKMAWTSESTTTGNSLRFSDTGDVGKYAGSNKLNSTEWETVTITLEELNAFARFGGNAWESLGSDGAKNWFIRCAYASTTVELYIDEIVYN